MTGAVSEQDGSFTNARDQKLVTVLFEPPQGVELKGVLARLHGLGDYSGRYAAGNKWFARKGYAVWMFDAHGHGLSEPSGENEKFAVNAFSHLVEDAEQFLSEIMLHVVGGGRVAPPDGLVLSATAAGIVRTPLMRVQEPLAGVLNILLPTAKLVPALEPERLLSCKDLIAAVHEDRMLNHANVRVCTACSMLHGTDTLAGKLPNISCPVIMLHGDCDVTCAASVAKEALEGMASRDKTWVLMANAKHDLELDLWRDAWFAYVLEWMNRQIVKLHQLRSGPVASSVGVKRAREGEAVINELRVQ